MVPIQKKGRSKRGHKDKVLGMALGSAPKSAGKKPSNRKKSNSQKPPVTETRDLLEGNRSVFVNPQAPVFPLNVALVPILPAIQQQTENNRLNSLFPEAAPHQPVIQNVFPFPHYRSPITSSPITRSPIPGFKDSRFQSISRLLTKKSNSQKPPVTETRDLLEGNRSVFVNPQAPVFPLNVALVPILPAIQQQTENNRLNSLFPEAAPHQPVIQNVFPFPHYPFPHYQFPHYPFSHSGF